MYVCMYCIVLFCTVLYCIVQYCIVLYCILYICTECIDTFEKFFHNSAQHGKEPLLELLLSLAILGVVGHLQVTMRWATADPLLC